MPGGKGVTVTPDGEINPNYPNLTTVCANQAQVFSEPEQVDYLHSKLLNRWWQQSPNPEAF